MVYNNLNDISRRKAALKAELKMHEKQISNIKKSLLSPTTSNTRKGQKAGVLSLVNSKNIVSTTVSVLDFAWFAWKIYKKFKKK